MKGNNRGLRAALLLVAFVGAIVFGDSSPVWSERLMWGAIGFFINELMHSN